MSQFETYLLALHWVLSHLSSSPSVILPTNSLEVIFTVFLIMLSMVVLGTCVSKLVSIMQELTDRHAEEIQELRQLQQYLRKAQVSAELHARITRYVGAGL